MFDLQIVGVTVTLVDWGKEDGEGKAPKSKSSSESLTRNQLFISKMSINT